MNKGIRPLLGVMVAASATLATGCDDWLQVENPTVIDASTIDPVEDAGTFARSALNNLWDAVDDAIVIGAWFSGEAWEGDSFPTRTDIGRRNIDFVAGTGTTNTTVDDDVYSPLARAIATGEQVQALLADQEDAATNINILRGTFASGWGILLEAELFCQVVISTGLDDLGAALASDAAAGEAVERFERVVTMGTAINADASFSGADREEALQYVHAARVGMARALLLQDNAAEAATVAAQVPADFEFFVPKVDDPSYRAALGNSVYSFTLDRQSLVVPPYYRSLNDPRIAFDLAQQATGPQKAQDGFLDFYRQTKYEDFGDDIRFASGLEARYLLAEANLKQGNPATALALIAERRAAFPDAATGDDADFVDAAGTLSDLLDQKARDFYLEGTHMGDWRRNPEATPYVPPAGSEYYNATEGGVFGTQTCVPVPDDEVLNNPNFGG